MAHTAAVTAHVAGKQLDAAAHSRQNPASPLGVCGPPPSPRGRGALSTSHPVFPRPRAELRRQKPRTGEVQGTAGWAGWGAGGRVGPRPRPGLPASLLPLAPRRPCARLTPQSAGIPLCASASELSSVLRDPQAEVGLRGKASGIENTPLARHTGVSKAALRGSATWPAAVSVAWLRGGDRRGCALLAPMACRGRRGRPCRPHSETQAGTAHPTTNRQ